MEKGRAAVELPSRRLQSRRAALRGLVSVATVGLVAKTIGACAPPTAAPGAGDGGVSVGAPSTVVVHGVAPIDVVLSDSGPSGPMTLVPFDSSAPAGDITFRVKNLGTVDHEMIILKTDTPFDQLPVTDAGDPPVSVATGANKVDEANNVGETGDPDLKPGDTRTFTVNLTPGKYVLLCNIAGHYQMGMRAPFTVTAATQTAATPASAVTVQLSDTGANSAMSLTTSSSVGAAGDIAFTVTNTGTVDHEMIILKTDTPFDQLPVTDAGDPPASVSHRSQQGRRSQQRRRDRRPGPQTGRHPHLHRQPDPRQVRPALQHRRPLPDGHARPVHGHRRRPRPQPHQPAP